MSTPAENNVADTTTSTVTDNSTQNLDEKSASVINEKSEPAAAEASQQEGEKKEDKPADDIENEVNKSDENIGDKTDKSEVIVNADENIGDKIDKSEVIVKEEDLNMSRQDVVTRISPAGHNLLTMSAEMFHRVAYNLAPPEVYRLTLSAMHPFFTKHCTSDLSRCRQCKESCAGGAILGHSDVPGAQLCRDELCYRCSIAFCDGPGCQARNQATATCSGCKRVVFCSKACQKKSWSHGHKFVCTARYFRSSAPTDGQDGALAFSLLHTSLLHHFETNLRTTNDRAPLNLCDIFPSGQELDDMGRPQVIIAGSSVVQAALGVRWPGSDIDIFCTWSAAPLIRQRLIQHCKMICSGANDSYRQQVRKLFLLPTTSSVLRIHALYFLLLLCSPIRLCHLLFSSVFQTHKCLFGADSLVYSLPISQCLGLCSQKNQSAR
jgi:ferredoxin